MDEGIEAQAVAVNRHSSHARRCTHTYIYLSTHTYDWDTRTLRATAATNAKSAAVGAPTTHNRDGYDDVERRRRRRSDTQHQDARARVCLPRDVSFHPTPVRATRSNDTISYLNADESVPLFKGRYVGLMSYPHGPTESRTAWP